MIEAMQNSEKIQVLDRALKILDTLMLSKQPLGVNEISKIFDLSPSAVFRILKTLKNNGWVFQCEDGKYIPGQKISFVTEKDNFYLALKEVSYYIMKKLTDSESHPMNLAVRHDNRFFILQQTRTSRYMDIVPPIGTSIPIHASAGGKILLCELPTVLKKEIIDTISFNMMTPYTIVRKSEFMDELDRVKKQEYALDYHESIENACCIGVPVRDNKNEIIAALSFSGIMGIATREQLLYYLPMLNDASKEITNRLFTLNEEYAQMELQE